MTPPRRLAHPSKRTFTVRNYDLAATLDSGQAFRWQREAQSWLGVIGRRCVRLRSGRNEIEAEVNEVGEDWNWLTHYLQLDVDLDAVIASFPQDAPLRSAVDRCRGLRLLRQDPWECLASFICSSNKRIVQIRQIIALLCDHLGEPLTAFSPGAELRTFPTAARIAKTAEAELRACKLGFRAKYLLETAQWVAEGKINLDALGQLPLTRAREELMQLPGVGRKIADCVLLFAYGLERAFPVDVWVAKALRGLYFPRRQMNLSQLHQFAESHFGNHAGYAQQYLFHSMRLQPAGLSPA